MGQLAQLAGATTLTGSVQVTDENGVSRSFDTEEEAEAHVAGRAVEHRRGAFFITGARPKPKVVAAPELAVAEKPKAKRKRRSEDEVPES